MGFVGVYSAIYDYQPQGQGELELREGDLLYVLEKSAEDDWWKAKKKADRDDEDEPEGLVPNNYVEEVRLDCDATTPLSPLPLILEQQSSLLGRSSDPSRDDSQRPMRAPLDFCSILLLAESFDLLTRPPVMHRLNQFTQPKPSTTTHAKRTKRYPSPRMPSCRCTTPRTPIGPSLG